jgi:hypothetical protein
MLITTQVQNTPVTQMPVRPGACALACCTAHSTVNSVRRTSEAKLYCCLLDCIIKIPYLHKRHQQTL